MNPYKIELLFLWREVVLRHSLPFPYATSFVEPPFCFSVFSGLLSLCGRSSTNPTSRYSVFSVIVIARIRNAFFRQLLCDLRGTFSGGAELEDVPDDGGAFFVGKDVPLGIVRVFLVSVGRSGRNSCAGLRLGTRCGASLLAAILRIEFVEEIAEGREVVGLLIAAVHAVIDGNEADAVAGKHQLSSYTIFALAERIRFQRCAGRFSLKTVRRVFFVYVMQIL